MKCIKKIKIGDTIYEAKTDFRTAIECNRIATDGTISNFERALGIICTMFGGEAIENPNHYELLLNWAKNYLSCGNEIEDTNEEPDMDYIQDMPYIEASFMSDYNIDLENEEMDWHKFNTLMNGLSNSEFGNCCVLNRIRNLRNYDISKIEDIKERTRLAKAKKSVALKKKEIQITKKQEASVEKFAELLGL